MIISTTLPPKAAKAATPRLWRQPIGWTWKKFAFAADPVGDFQRVQEEFILADMVQTEGRLERLRKQNALKPQPALQQEQALLEQCLAHLEAEQVTHARNLAS